MIIPDKVLKHANQNGISDKDRERYLKSWLKPTSFICAIKAMCVECCGFEDTVPRIKNCNIIVCPLNKLRPFQGKKIDETNEDDEDLDAEKTHQEEMK